MRWLNYVKSAFVYHWNLLALAGGVGVALLSGHPDIGLPLVAAAEIAYLGLLGTNPRFQKAIDARAAKQEREAATGGDALERMLSALPPKSLARFHGLRERCTDLRRIAVGLQGDSGPVPLEELQLSGLDRLLWTFLRLLYTEHMMDLFLRSTSAEQIKRTMTNLEQSLKSQSFPPEDHQKQKIRAALEENLQSCRDRLVNLEKGQANAQLVRAELDSLESRIQSLGELAVNRHEPGYLAGQVDQVAASMAATEQTISDLRFATGLTEEEQVPRLMERQVQR